MMNSKIMEINRSQRKSVKSNKLDYKKKVFIMSQRCSGYVKYANLALKYDIHREMLSATRENKGDFIPSLPKTFPKTSAYDLYGI